MNNFNNKLCKIKIQHIIEINNTLEHFYKYDHVNNIIYFKNYPNDIIPYEIILNKIINKYNCNNILHFTHKLNDRTRFDDIYNNGINQYDCILFNPIRANMGYIKYDFYLECLLYSLVKILNKIKNIKLLVIRINLSIMLPFTYNVLFHLNNFSDNFKFIKAKKFNILCIIFHGVTNFFMNINNLNYNFNSLLTIINNSSDTELLNEIASSDELKSNYFIDIISDNKSNKSNKIKLINLKTNIINIKDNIFNVVLINKYNKLIHNV